MTRGALLAVDNCFCTPALQRPVELGADLVIHSGTKYLDGQGRVIAGAICASARAGRREARAGDAQRRHEPVALQRVGGAQGPGDAVDAHAGAERRALQLAQLAGRATADRARLPPRAGLASAARAGDGAAVGLRRRGGVVHRQGPASGPAAAPCVPRIDAHAGLLDHRQPRRHQDHHHAPGQHLARRGSPKPSARPPASRRA